MCVMIQKVICPVRDILILKFPVKRCFQFEMRNFYEDFEHRIAALNYSTVAVPLHRSKNVCLENFRMILTVFGFQRIFISTQLFWLNFSLKSILHAILDFFFLWIFMYWCMHVCGICNRIER